MQSLIGNKEPMRFKPLVFKNLQAHKQRNIKLGMMYLTTIMFATFTNATKNQLQKLMLSSMQRVMGSDLVLGIANSAKIDSTNGM